MFPEPTELVLIGYLIESNWTPKSKSNTLTPKTNSQTCWPREISHVMNGSIFCVCLTLAISVLQSVLKWCRKEHKKDAGEERVTAKSKPMMILVSRRSERTPDVLSSIASESPEKTRHESQTPLSPQTEKYDRTERPVVSSQHADRFIIENDGTNSYAEAESELSSGSRSFLHRVNDQVRKRQKQSLKDATKGSDKHSVIWWMFISSTLQASVFMVKNCSDNWHSIRNTEDLTLKQMFDIFWEIDIRTIRWDQWSENNYLGRLFMEVFVFDWWWTSHQSLAHNGLRILRFCIVSWKDEREPSIKYCMGRQIDLVQKFIRIPSFGQNWWWANGIRVEHLPRIHHIALCHKVQELLSSLSGTPEKFTVRIIFMSMFNDISWGSKISKKECESNAQLVSLYAKRFGAGQWSFLGPGSEKKWYSISEDSPHGEWDRIAEQMMLTFAESKHPVFRSMSPLSRGVLESKGGGKLSIRFCADGRYDWNFFSHHYFSKSAPYLRSSRRNVWRIWILSR